jgi:aspartyl protease family protein
VTDPNLEPDDSNRIGFGMMTAACTTLLLLLIVLFSGVLKKLNNPNPSISSRITDTVAEITLSRNRQGHYVASGTMNGQEVVFLIDTGATDVAIPNTLAHRLGLVRGPRSQYNTANGLIEAHQATLDSVVLGNIEVREVRASIVPNMSDDHVLLGMSFLRHLNFSQEDNQLTIRQRLNP